MVNKYYLINYSMYRILGVLCVSSHSLSSVIITVPPHPPTHSPVYSSILQMTSFISSPLPILYLPSFLFHPPFLLLPPPGPSFPQSLTVHGGTSGSSTQAYLGHILDSYNQASMFVLMEGPDSQTASKFWEVVWDQGCGYIVMLTPLDAERVRRACLCGCGHMMRQVIIECGLIRSWMIGV